MEIKAIVINSAGKHEVQVQTADMRQTLTIAPKAVGNGSSINGGEFLMLALATCYCNDLYREAARLGMTLDVVEVAAMAEFPGIGLAATNIRYCAIISSKSSPSEIAELIRQTDAVAEVHNTIRCGLPVELIGA